MSQIDVTVEYTSFERCRGKHGGWNSSIAAFFGNFCLYRGGNREGTGQVLFARDTINVSPRATIQFANIFFFSLLVARVCSLAIETADRLLNNIS